MATSTAPASKPRSSSRSRARSFELGARVLRAASFALCTLALTSVGACKNKEKNSCNPDDYVFEELSLFLQASADVNQNDEGEALPVVVRVYQLNGDIATRNLDFNELWEDAEAALGDEYISDKEIQLFPDSNEVISVTPESGAKFVLVFAVFNSPVAVFALKTSSMSCS